MAIIITSNLKEFRAALKRTTNSFNSVVLARKLRVAWSNELYKFNRTHFNTRGHGSWAPLTPKYAKRKRASGFGSKILRRRGDLFKSVTQGGGQNQTQIQRSNFGFNYTFRTTERKADWHHRGRGRLSVRTVIEPTQKQENRLQRVGANIMGRHLAQKLKPFGKIKGNVFRVISPMTGDGTS